MVASLSSMQAMPRPRRPLRSWKIGSNWTVNAGLRWDEQDLRNYAGRSVVKTVAEWQPRLFVVWDPGAHGKMKVYASAGRFYYALPTSFSLLASTSTTVVRAASPSCAVASIFAFGERSPSRLRLATSAFRSSVAIGEQTTVVLLAKNTTSKYLRRRYDDVAASINSGWCSR